MKLDANSEKIVPRILEPPRFSKDTSFIGAGITWEGMLGFGVGHWDFVCQHNLVQSVALLGEIVEKVVMLPEADRGKAFFEH